MLEEQVEATLAVGQALENLGVRYAIGGSFASAVHGVMRATMDAGLLTDLSLSHAEPFAEALEGRFYVDVMMIQEAIRNHGSFNLIHLDTMFKVDIFVAKPRAFDRLQLSRRQLLPLDESPERRAYVATAEDTVLSKLEWYRVGGEVSDRQWHDVMGVLKVQAERLDLDYLYRMAAELGVADLLGRALDEAS